MHTFFDIYIRRVKDSFESELRYESELKEIQIDQWQLSETKEIIIKEIISGYDSHHYWTFVTVETIEDLILFHDNVIPNIRKLQFENSNLNLYNHIGLLEVKEYFNDINCALCKISFGMPNEKANIRGLHLINDIGNNDKYRTLNAQSKAAIQNAVQKESFPAETFEPEPLARS
jgi:hypothetical protein